MNNKIYDMGNVSDGSERRDKYRYLIIAPNIEVRSRTAFRILKRTSAFDTVLIADYPNFHKELTSEQEEELQKEYDGIKVEKVSGISDDEIIQKMCGRDIKPNDSIAIDITGFSIPNIYQVMDILKEEYNIRHIDVFYTEPKFYVYERGYFDAYHKSVRERKCAPILGYYNSGFNEKEILTIFLGFDGGLADLVYFKLGEEGKEIIQTLVVNGFPSYTSKLKDVSLFNNEDIITKIGLQNVLYSAANNPFEAYNLLCGVKKQYKNILLNLCTIGSKPMALGTCLFALDNKDSVKVTYPFYEKTRFDDTEEAGKTWRYGISF